MSYIIDIFSLPGFQPVTADRQSSRLEASVDGSIDAIFYKDRPLNEHTPIFCIYIGKEFGNEARLYREFDNHFVTAERDTDRGVKHYRFRVSAKDVQILPGNYVLRFFADNEEVAVRYLALRNSLVQSPHLPQSFQP